MTYKILIKLSSTYAKMAVQAKTTIPLLQKGIYPSMHDVALTLHSSHLSARQQSPHHTDYIPLPCKYRDGSPSPCVLYKHTAHGYPVILPPYMTPPSSPLETAPPLPLPTLLCPRERMPLSHPHPAHVCKGGSQKEGGW